MPITLCASLCSSVGETRRDETQSGCDSGDRLLAPDVSRYTMHQLKTFHLISEMTPLIMNDAARDESVDTVVSSIQWWTILAHFRLEVCIYSWQLSGQMTIDNQLLVSKAHQTAAAYPLLIVCHAPTFSHFWSFTLHLNFFILTTVPQCHC